MPDYHYITWFKKCIWGSRSSLTIENTWIHHIPENIKLLISEYYDDYAITIATDQYKIDPLIVGKGVLQGDCLSPLFFNLVVNTLIKL